MRYEFSNLYVPSFSTSGDADDRPTEEVAFYYNKIAFGVSLPSERNEFTS